MVVLQAEGSVMAGAGGWGQGGGRVQAPYIGGSNQPPPEKTFLLPTHPTRPEAQSSHPCPAAPPQPQGPSVMLIWMWEASLSGDPPQGTAQQFQKNRDLYF